MIHDRHESAARFRALHDRAAPPLVLCNIWDVGSARAVALSGAGGVATSSWAVAAARGVDDGEALPFEVLCALTGQIARSSAVFHAVAQHDHDTPHDDPVVVKWRGDRRSCDRRFTDDRFMGWTWCKGPDGRAG